MKIYNMHSSATLMQSVLPEEDDDAGVDFCCDNNDDLGYDDNDE